MDRIEPGWKTGSHGPIKGGEGFDRKDVQSNPSWGSPRIVGELRKLGIEVSKSTVEKYKVSRRKPPSPTWIDFPDHHLKELVHRFLYSAHGANLNFRFR